MLWQLGLRDSNKLSSIRRLPFHCLFFSHAPRETPPALVAAHAAFKHVPKGRCAVLLVSPGVTHTRERSASLADSIYPTHHRRNAYDTKCGHDYAEDPHQGVRVLAYVYVHVSAFN